jgi:hypothetical protein
LKAPPEKLGSFYLGGKYDLDKNSLVDEPINYDARDLTTHAVCFGMTGSGKTGLCVCLLEEAALDRVPAILIDPKGDLTNLLLQFPELKPEDFLPWVNVDDARRKGLSLQDYSVSIADSWRKGLGDWGISTERIKALKDSVDYTIFTPGSEAGVPISIMSSLASPHLDFKIDGEAARDMIRGVVAALLDILEAKVDPLRSAEGILLTNIFEYYWSKDEDLTLEKLINAVQKPPFQKLGVFDIEAFYPEKRRFDLAMSMNTLIASPSFSGWLIGEPLDVDKLLYNSAGNPRHSIFYLAHLSDSERMFFVTLLLESVITWMRKQQGTTSLRALLYFDEVFGFMPPVAEPSSKKPLMTLLKQARAFGLGLTLVTQNPVDIDYKGLTNAGTWFIGKLQAERDKQKVVEGLKGAISESGGTSEADYDLLITKLSNRVFLMHDINQGRPIIMYSRWAMSYLRGPLTKPQISTLMKGKQVERKIPLPEKQFTALTTEELSENKPSIDPNIMQVILKDSIENEEAVRRVFEGGYPPRDYQATLIYEPRLLAKASVEYYNAGLGIDNRTKNLYLLNLNEETGGGWDSSEKFSENDLKFMPESVLQLKKPALYKPIPSQINRPDKIQRYNRALVEYLLQNSRFKILAHKKLGVTQKTDETERDYLIRLRDTAREHRDSEVTKLQEIYEEKLDKIDNKIRTLERELADDRKELDARKREEYLGIGETVLGFFIGRKRTSVATTTSRRMRMAEKAKNDVEETQSTIDDLKEETQKLETELKDETQKITSRWDNIINETIESEVKPTRNNIKTDLIALAWTPTWRVTWNDDGVTKYKVVTAYK